MQKGVFNIVCEDFLQIHPIPFIPIPVELTLPKLFQHVLLGHDQAHGCFLTCHLKRTTFIFFVKKVLIRVNTVKTRN